MAPSVAVIGSGVAGAATAFALARAGANVRVFDSGRNGQASAAGAGIIAPWSSRTEGPVYELYAAGAAYYPTLIAALAETGVTDIGYRASGSLIVAEDPARLDEAEDRVRRRAADAPAAGAVARLSGRRARELFPPLAPGLPAVHVEGAARVDGRRLRDGMLEAARRLGATVEPEQAQPGIADGSCVAYTSAGAVAADVVVVAAGAWTDEVLDPLGYRVAVEPQRGQLAHLLLPGVETAHWPSVLPLAEHYLVAFDAGRIVAGATRETGSGFDPRTTAAGVRDVLADALSVAPGLASATLLEFRVGLRPLADRPAIGAVRGLPGLFLVTGFGAAGLTMAPVAGAALAQVILGRTPELDLSAFAPPEHG